MGRGLVIEAYFGSTVYIFLIFEWTSMYRSSFLYISYVCHESSILLLQAHPDLIHAFQAAAVAGGSSSSSAAVNKSLNAAIIGEALPRGRGGDERAARAAAEVRKKAAARGLLIRPHGVPVQALPPFTQLLNIINSGVNPEASNNEENGGNKEVNGHPPSEAGDASVHEESKPGQQDQTPVGLGTGLKQKTKAKVAS